MVIAMLVYKYIGNRKWGESFWFWIASGVTALILAFFLALIIPQIILPLLTGGIIGKSIVSFILTYLVIYILAKYWKKHPNASKIAIYTALGNVILRIVLEGVILPSMLSSVIGI